MGKNHRREVEESSSQDLQKWWREREKKSSLKNWGRSPFYRGHKNVAVGAKKWPADNPAWGRPGNSKQRLNGRSSALGSRPAPGLGRPGTLAGPGTQQTDPACYRPVAGLAERLGREAARAGRPQPGLGPARPARQIFFLFFLNILSKKRPTVTKQ